MRTLAKPVFAQPEPTEDPGTFRIPHASDSAAYAQIDELNKEHKLKALPFPTPRGGGGGGEPKLALIDVLGKNQAWLDAIAARKQLVFHAFGDCGSVRGPRTQNEVADKLVSDFHEADPREVPEFALLLGDIVYSFGEAKYYYDQFYEPYRDYPAPILAAPGNHDGMVTSPTDPEVAKKSLAAYLNNFCQDHFVVTDEAGGLSRTAQIQPGVYFTFDAPFVRIIVLYSNVLEDPGVLADDDIGTEQLAFLTAALRRAKNDAQAGSLHALVFAMHHPPYAAGRGAGRHGSSPHMLAQMDKACEDAGFWPHAVLSGHVHNYQRFTRLRGDGTQLPYVSCGSGGHDVISLSGRGHPVLRVPQVIQAKSRGDQVTFESYDDRHYGYLRVVATDTQLRIEFHAASDGPNVKAPDDAVTVNLATRRLEHFDANDHGLPARAAELRAQSKR